MRIGIGFKLFVAVLAASVVMAVAMSIANRISFQRGFLGYLNEVETRRLNVLTTVLAAHWREVGATTCGGTLCAIAATGCIRGRGRCRFCPFWAAGRFRPANGWCPCRMPRAWGRRAG